MGYIDMHSHILPGLDDGSRSMEQSLAMLRIAYEEGITTMIATPHNMPGKGRPSKETIREKIHLLQIKADEENISIKILMGTEYYYREEVLNQFEEENAITMGASDHVLVEFNPMEEKSYIRNAINDINSTGYTPIIAHIERYVQLMKDFDTVEDLSKMGALIQVNAASITGDNGRQAKSDTKKLLKRDLVDFVSTDAHSHGHRAPYIRKCATILSKRYGADYADKLLYRNAQVLLLQNK